MRKTLVGAMVLGLCAVALGADQPQEVQRQLTDAQREIVELRAKYDALAQRLEQTERRVSQAPTSDELVRLVAEVKGAQGNVIDWRSKFEGITIEFYGYIKADAVYDTAKTSDVNQAAFVLPRHTAPYTVDETDGEFGMSAMQTRLGMNVKGPDVVGAKTSGTVEIDFYGTMAPENKARIMLRRAFVRMDWGQVWTEAGQDWELFSLAAPDVLNYPYLALAGNPGYRRPMWAVGGNLKAGDVTLDAAVAIVRVMGEIGTFGSGVTQDTGSQSGWPAVQARAGAAYPLWGGKRSVSVHVSGVIGEEQVNTPPTDSDFPTWGVAVDTEIPVFVDEASPFAVVLKGEVWTGENMDEWLGGVGQGINAVRGTTIGASGGWGQATVFLPDGKTRVNLGAGIDSADAGDLAGMTGLARTQNVVYFSNIIHNLSKQLSVGFEVMYFETEYLLLNDGNCVRFQVSVQYNF